MTGCKVRLSFYCLITAQSSPAGRTRGNLFLDEGVGLLMVAIWFSMRSRPWSWRDRVLYLCVWGTVGFPLVIWYAEGGMGSISSRIMRGSF